MNKQEALSNLSAIPEPNEVGALRTAGAILAVLNTLGAIGAVILAIQSESAGFVGLAIGLGIMAWVNTVIFDAAASVVSSVYITAQATITQAKYLISSTNEENEPNKSDVNNSMPLL